MNIEYAKDPQWANIEKTLINLTVKFTEIDEELPFTASPNDSVAYGIELFNRAAAGEFGAVAELPPPPPPTPEQTQKQLTNAVQRHLDTTAQERGYDGIMSLCTYATSHNPKFVAEGQAGVIWRDAVWAACYGLLDEVMSGQREIPTAEELIVLLPEIVWPS